MSLLGFSLGQEGYYFCTKYIFRIILVDTVSEATSQNRFVPRLGLIFQFPYESFRGTIRISPQFLLPSFARLLPRHYVTLHYITVAVRVATDDGHSRPKVDRHRGTDGRATRHGRWPCERGEEAGSARLFVNGAISRAFACFRRARCARTHPHMMKKINNTECCCSV